MSILNEETKCPQCKKLLTGNNWVHSSYIKNEIRKVETNGVLYFVHTDCIEDFAETYTVHKLSRFSGNGIRGAFYWLLAFIFLIYLYTHLFIFYLIFTALSIKLGSYFEHYLLDLDSFYSLGLLGFISGIFLYTFFIYKYRKAINKVRDDIDLAYWLWVSFVILYILVAMYIIMIFTEGSY